MARITSLSGRIVYNGRGDRSLEIEIVSDNTHMGRACAPSGASVGRHEAAAFAGGDPRESLRAATGEKARAALVGLDPADAEAVHGAVRRLDGGTGNYSGIGGAAAYAVSLAAAESAAAAAGEPLFAQIARYGGGAAEMRIPYPLGNVLGGGAHAGPGTPDIQEVLVFAPGAGTAREAIEANLAVHRAAGEELRRRDPAFTNGRGDEGGWAPRLDNEGALEVAAAACERLGRTLGKDVSLGVDFAASTQWDARRGVYAYGRAGFENSPGEQVEFASSLMEKYKLAYAEDAVHEEDFAGMAELASRFPGTMVTGDDLTVTSAAMLEKAAAARSCNAAILKVNQAGGLLDALRFAAAAAARGIDTVTSHRSGESPDAHIAHVGIAAGSKLLKAGIAGGERVAKTNELLRASEHDLIRGMARLRNR